MVEKCKLDKVLSGHSEKLVKTYKNITSTTHDVVFKCPECNTSWTKTGIKHVYYQGECPCGHDQAVTGIVLSRTSATLEKGQTLKLTATILPSGAKGNIQWLSTKPTIAYVSGGTVQAKAVGTATITAKINNTIKAQCVITVVKAEEPEQPVNPSGDIVIAKCSKDGIVAGHEEKLTYTYSDKKTKTHDVTIKCNECKKSWKLNDVEHNFVEGKCACGKNPKAETIMLNQTQATMKEGEKLNY